MLRAGEKLEEPTEAILRAVPCVAVLLSHGSNFLLSRLPPSKRFSLTKMVEEKWFYFYNTSQ